MQADRYSRTALNVAFIRAQHHLHDEPKLLDDPYAHRLLTEAEMAAFAEAYVRTALDLGVAPGDPAAVLARVHSARLQGLSLPDGVGQVEPDTRG